MKDNLDYSVLPSVLKDICEEAGVPLSDFQVPLISGAMAQIQSMINKEGLKATIEKFK